ncbi:MULTISPECIES: hypothetical protein [Clostridiaceae]|uniref:hypothetical protein n=1 Tax=Clostridiaceae TaxID=31979 RepID=UPI000ABC3AEA|nr:MULTISPECIES: hypothetical protein [Clostridiaceae]
MKIIQPAKLKLKKKINKDNGEVTVMSSQCDILEFGCGQTCPIQGCPGKWGFISACKCF